MTIQVFGAQATVSYLNRAFTDTSPANLIFNNQVARVEKIGEAAFANEFAAGWSGLTNAALSKQVLTNMGILPTTDTSVAALEQALTDYFTAFGAKTAGTNGQTTADTRGFIVLQLASILSNSETSTGNLAVYNAAAVAWNSEVAASYSYSANPANTTPTQSGTTGQSLTLTVNQDAIVGATGDDAINAFANQNGSKLINTLQSVDTIDGGTGNDTLNVTLAETLTVAPSMKNVENVAVRFADTGTLQFAGVTGLTAVTVANSTNTGILSDIGALASLSIKNQNAGVNVTSTAGSATTMALGFDTVGTKTSTTVTPITLDLGAPTAGVSNASKVTTANITMKDAYVKVDSTAADVISTATVAATGSNTLTLTDSQATLTKITVTGDGSLNLMEGGALLSALTTFDASAAKGAVKAEITNTAKAVTITTGTGNDYIKAPLVTIPGTTANLGAGDDVLIVGNNIGAFDKSDGGAGTDIINITNGLTTTAVPAVAAVPAVVGPPAVAAVEAQAATTATTYKTISNFETLDISGAKAGVTYDVSLNNFPTVQIDEAISGALLGAVTLNNTPDTFAFNIASKKGTAVFTTGGVITVTGKDYAGTTATSDAETFSLVAKLVDGDQDGTIEGNILSTGITVNNVENLNVTATVTVDGGTTAAANVASNYLLTPVFTANSVETIVIKGDASVNFTGTNFGNTNAVTTVDASASTGNIIAAAAYNNAVASIKYLGAAGVDTYIASGKGDSLYTAKGGDQITLAGGRDTLVYKLATDSQITDISKDGKLTLAADMGVAGTIVAGAYTANPNATIDSITTFQLAATAAAATATDRIDVTNFGFTGVQRGVENVTAKVSGTTDLTSVTGLFSSTAGNRGVAFTTLAANGTDSYVFVDANKDGNFTAADDLVIKLTGVTNLTETDINF